MPSAGRAGEQSACRRAPRRGRRGPAGPCRERGRRRRCRRRRRVERRRGRRVAATFTSARVAPAYLATLASASAHTKYGRRLELRRAGAPTRDVELDRAPERAPRASRSAACAAHPRRARADAGRARARASSSRSARQLAAGPRLRSSPSPPRAEAGAGCRASDARAAVPAPAPQLRLEPRAADASAAATQPPPRGRRARSTRARTLGLQRDVRRRQPRRQTPPPRRAPGRRAPRASCTSTANGLPVALHARCRSRPHSGFRERERHGPHRPGSRSLPATRSRAASVGVAERAGEPVAQRPRAAVSPSSTDEVSDRCRRRPQSRVEPHRATEEHGLEREQRGLEHIHQEHRGERDGDLERGQPLAPRGAGRRGESARHNGHERDGEHDGHRIAAPHRRGNRGGVSDSDGEAVEPRARPDAGVGDEEVDERAAVQIQQVGREVAEEPGAAGGGQQYAGATPPGERPGRDEAQADSEVREPESRLVPRSTGRPRPRGPAPAPRRREAPSGAGARRAPRPRALFAMNPRAGACFRRGPYAAARRLETSTTAGGSRPRRDTLRDGDPVQPRQLYVEQNDRGSKGSDRPRSPPRRPPPRRRPRTPPPRAEPERAARNSSWSSTIRTVGRTAAIVSRGAPAHTVAGTESAMSRGVSLRSSPNAGGGPGVAAAGRCRRGTHGRLVPVRPGEARPSRAARASACRRRRARSRWSGSRLSWFSSHVRSPTRSRSAMEGAAAAPAKATVTALKTMMRFMPGR